MQFKSFWKSKIWILWNLEWSATPPGGPNKNTVLPRIQKVINYLRSRTELVLSGEKIIQGSRPLFVKRYSVDSTVLLTPQGTVQKLYHPWVSRDLVEQYHILHKRLADHLHSIMLPKWVFMKNKQGFPEPISSLEVEVLELWSSISEIYTKGDHVAVVTSEVEFVPGDTLIDVPVFRGNRFFRIQYNMDILMKIGKELDKLLGFPLFVNWDGLHDANIKVISIQDGVLKLKITDLGASIPRLMESYHELSSIEWS